MSGGVHTFDESLARSHAYADAPWWDAVYREAFPTFAAMVDMRHDGWHQRAGIDRLVILQNSTAIKIDEKVRDKDYGDILLEFWSDRGRKHPGWIAKDLGCDFIAYAIAPSQVCYLLPFQTLRRAWKLNRREWVDRFGTREAINPGYVTVSVPVPVPDLMLALQGAMTVAWGAAE